MIGLLGPHVTQDTLLREFFHLSGFSEYHDIEKIKSGGSHVYKRMQEE